MKYIGIIIKVMVIVAVIIKFSGVAIATIVRWTNIAISIIIGAIATTLAISRKASIATKDVVAAVKGIASATYDKHNR